MLDTFPFVELPPRPDFAESSFDLATGADVRELDALPPEALDLEEVVREAEERLS